MPPDLPVVVQPSGLSWEVILAGAALVATLVLWAVDRVWISSGKITYRVHLDTPVNVTPAKEASEFELDVRRDGEEVEDASIALVRIRNQGSRDIEASDINGDMRLTFPARTVLSAVVVDASSPVLRALVQEEVDGDYEGLAHLPLPKQALNRGDSYKVLVLLTGSGNGVKGEAHITGAKFVPDSGRIAPSRRSLALGAGVVLFSGLLGGLVWNQTRTAADLCVPGELTVEGSTAFTPLMEDMAARYEDACPGAEIEVAGTGSLEGVQNLVEDAGADPEVAGGRLAMSDVEVDYADLVGEQVGALLFSFVINTDAGVTDLTTEQLRDIYAGEYRTWEEVDPVAGSAEPIILVSRDARSGTRATVERRVLAQGEGAVTSDDCTTPRPVPGQGDGLPLRCEKRETSQVLAEVDTNPGALGYAQLSDIQDFDGVAPVTIDGVAPSVEAIRDASYDLWSREQLYTFGPPAQGTLLRAFIDFVTLEYLPTPEAQQQLIDNGFVPLTAATP